MSTLNNNRSLVKTSMTVTNLVLTGMFTAIICVMSVITIPTQPIPFTLSLLAVFLTGTLLTPRYALFAVLSYILLGAFGLPVFSNFRSGVQVITGMTGGYIMAYPLVAFIPALCYKYVKSSKIIRTTALLIGMVFSLFLCYLIGTLWFVFVTGTGFYEALTLCVFPYLFFDLCKIGIAAFLGTLLRETALKQYYTN